jgi:hypothetical protein
MSRCTPLARWDDLLGEHTRPRGMTLRCSAEEIFSRSGVSEGASFHKMSEPDRRRWARTPNVAPENACAPQNASCGHGALKKGGPKLRVAKMLGSTPVSGVTLRRPAEEIFSQDRGTNGKQLVLAKSLNVT